VQRAVPRLDERAAFARLGEVRLAAPPLRAQLRQNLGDVLLREPLERVRVRRLERLSGAVEGHVHAQPPNEEVVGEATRALQRGVSLRPDVVVREGRGGGDRREGSERKRPHASRGAGDGADGARDDARDALDGARDGARERCAHHARRDMRVAGWSGPGAARNGKQRRFSVRVSDGKSRGRRERNPGTNRALGHLFAARW
jgi:hypothetical protein